MFSNNTLIFGDSFIGPFTLLKSNNLILKKFKGATMKGLTKPNHFNRQEILKIINRHNHKIKCVIFMFGNVDFNFSIYYTKLIQKKEIELDSIVEKYIEFIDSIHCECQKIVFNVFPTTIEDKEIFGCLQNYGIIEKDILNNLSKEIKEELSNHSFRFSYYKRFNNKLKEECKKRNITFIDLEKEFLDNDNKILNKYKDPESPYNVHILWEPVIGLFVEKLRNCGLKKIFKDDPNKTLRNFALEKKERMKYRLKNRYLLKK